MGKIAASPETSVPVPQLPAAGPSNLIGMPVAPSGLGAGGQTSFSIPLPISPGRGYAPRLALSSGGGNGVFGLGWQLSGIPSIRRRTDRGLPTYTEDDTFIGPDGEVLVKAALPTRTRNTYTITSYRPRVEGSFDLIERWTSPTGDPGEGFPAPRDFWLLRGADGSQMCLGQFLSQIREPATNRTVEWLIQESVSADGQHIRYDYSNASSHLSPTSNLYLESVRYGNPISSTDLYSLPGNQRVLNDWLFILAFDYGTEVQPDINSLPGGLSTYGDQHWTHFRQDPFSRFDSGFEIRNGYLCRQVLMYHFFPDGKYLTPDGMPSDANGTLVRRMVFSYDENPAFSRLTGVQVAAYESDATKTAQLLPPLDIEWTPDFIPPAATPAWQELALPLTEPLGAAPAPDFMPYGLTDIYSEGMSGLLHQQGNCWYYRRPERDQRAGAAPDAITFGARELLPLVPTLQGGAGSLVDINGDGRLEWLVTTPANGSGYYVMEADRSWSAFKPLTNLPLEILAPYSMYVNVHGAGLPDVVVLSPNSVRYYANQSTDTEIKFAAPVDVPQAPDIVLPIPGRNPCEWVGFADVLGSGQSHLVRIRNDSVTCWPWLGNGQFGSPRTLTTTLPFQRDTFNPAHVFLVPIFGPGAPDIVYADVSGLTIVRNQSGNRFDTTSTVSIPYPAGVHMGALTQVSFPDLCGRGSPSVLLTQPLGGANNAVRHWRLDLYPESPAFQLLSVNNNMGAHCDLAWRSSIQDWMEEKLEQPDAASGFPAPSMLVGALRQIDEFTGLQFVQTASYRRGVWDGHEREPRGYAYSEDQQSTRVTATDLNADGTATRVTRNWYHTGRETDVGDVTQLYGKPFIDAQAYKQGPTRLTTFVSSPPNAANPWHDELYGNASQNTAWWMHRSLKGMLLRSETYDADQLLTDAPTPYSVQYNRWQVREVQSSNTMPVVLPMDLEQLSYNYEQVRDDPLITQQLSMDSDAYGYALWTVAVAYPRRLSASASNPYASLPWYGSGNATNDGSAPAAEVPNNSWMATFDEQQTQLRLTESRYDVENNNQPEGWRLGILNASRQNALTPNSPDPSKGLSVETLSQLNEASCPLAPGQKRDLQAYSRITYAGSLPQQLRRVQYTTTALLDAKDKAFVDTLDSGIIDAAGYESCALTLAVPGLQEPEAPVWAGRFGITNYLPIGNFARPSDQCTSALNGADNVAPCVTFSWDRYQCAITGMRDAYANTLSWDIDYRFLTPWQLLDANQNTTQVQQDALGRVVATSFFGTQLSQDGTSVESVGFSDLPSHPANMTDTVAGALANSSLQPQASKTVYETMSAMPQLNRQQIDAADPALAPGVLWSRLIAHGFMTSQGHIRSRGRRWARARNRLPGIPDHVREILAVQSSPQPAHCLTLVADAWNSPQVLRASVAHVDGQGRELRTAIKVPSGQAFLRKDNGDLLTSTESPALAQRMADSRWAVAGTAMSTPAGQALTVWPPYFVNDWQFVNIGALPVQGYADRFFLDALDREVLAHTGLDYWRRTSHAPWFVIEEDENDLDAVIRGATLQITDTSMEAVGLLPAAAQDGQLPAMTAATGSDFVDDKLVLTAAAGTIWVSWKPGFAPQLSNTQTIFFTDNRGVKGSLQVDRQTQYLYMSFESDSDRLIQDTPVYSVLTTDGYVMGFLMLGANIDKQANTVSGRLQAFLGEEPYVWDSGIFDQFSVSVRVSHSPPHEAVTQALTICDPAFYAVSNPFYDDPDTGEWPYSTANLDVKSRPAYVLVIARGGTDRAHWLATSDLYSSFGPDTSVRTQVPADYSNSQVIPLYTGIVCIDENDQVIEESWRRAFYKVVLGH